MPRGIPDGKSDEIVADELANDEDVQKYNIQGNKKVIYQPYTQRGMQIMVLTIDLVHIQLFGHLLDICSFVISSLEKYILDSRALLLFNRLYSQASVFPFTPSST